VTNIDLIYTLCSGYLEYLSLLAGLQPWQIGEWSGH